MAQRRLVRAGRLVQLGGMRAALLAWHLGHVPGTAQPTAPARQHPETLNAWQRRRDFSSGRRAGVGVGGQSWGREPEEGGCQGRAGGRGGAVAMSMLAASCCVSAAGPPREGDLSPAAVCHRIQPKRSCAGCHDNRDRSYDPLHFLNINVFYPVYVTPWKPNVEQERLHKNEQNTE